MVDLEGRTLYEALGVAKDASQVTRLLLPPPPLRRCRRWRRLSARCWLQLNHHTNSSAALV